MNPPRLSIVVPTYRRPRLLREALDSARAQTLRDIEVIVTDNDADPAVRELVEGLGDPRVRYRCNDGPTSALGNAVAGYRAARAPLLGTLHDDDAWEPTAAERLVTPLEADEDLVVAFSDYWHVTAEGVVDERASRDNSRRFGLDVLRPGTHRPFAELALVRESVPLVLAAVFRASAVDWSAVDERADPLTDRWLNHLLARTGRGAHYVPERLTRYRVHGSALSTTSRSYEAAVFCAQQWLQDPALQDLRPGLRAHLAAVHRVRGLDLLREGRAAEARPVLAAARACGAGRDTDVAALLARLPAPVGAAVLRAWGRRRGADSSDHLSLPKGRT